MDKNVEELKLLISEKEHADRQISSYLELQIKLIALIFSALAIALGWIFSQKGWSTLDTDDQIVILLVILSVSCFAILQSSITYGISLGYMYYKNVVVGKRLQRCLTLAENPLQALAAWSSSPARRPVLFATFTIVIIHSLANVLLWSAACFKYFSSTGSYYIASFLVAAGLLLVASIVVQILVARAMAHVGMLKEERKPKAVEA